MRELFLETAVIRVACKRAQPIIGSRWSGHPVSWGFEVKAGVHREYQVSHVAHKLDLQIGSSVHWGGLPVYPEDTGGARCQNSVIILTIQAIHAKKMRHLEVRNRLKPTNVL